LSQHKNPAIFNSYESLAPVVLKRVLLAYAPAIAWAAVVLFIGSRSKLPVPAFDLPIDKVGHFAMYAVLGTLAGRAYMRTRTPPVIIILAMLAIGALDELNQRTVPGRSSELLDWVADAAGSVAGFAFVTVYLRAIDQRKQA
jgi:VanZ family protein